MDSVRKDIVNNKGNIYNVKIVFDETRTMTDMFCHCRFMSFDFWSKRFQKLGTICRHILQVCAEEDIKLPKKYQTPRNLKLMETFKDGKEKRNKEG